MYLLVFLGSAWLGVSRLSRPTFAWFHHRPPEPDGAERAADGRADEIGLRADAPKPRAKKGASRDNAVADEVVGSVGARPELRRGLSDDQRFTGRFAKFLQAAHDEGHGEPREVVRPHQRDREQREEDKRRQDK